MKSTREQRAWFVYDWANSAFYTTVVTLFLGPWLTALASNAAGPDGLVRPFGIPIAAKSYWPYLVSLAVLLQVLFLPLLGAIADYGRRKRELLGLFAYLGAGATMAMFALDGTRYLLGGVLFLIANLCFGASIVIYNSFLPEIAGPEERDSVSSKGWGIGYVGGGLLLALNLIFYTKAESFGVTQGFAVRISLASAGLWWAVFTIVPMLVLRNRGEGKKLPAGKGYLSVGVEQLGHTLRDVRRYPQTLLFLLAFLIYNDGIQTVITLASQFGQEELKLPMSTLTAVILLVQFLAFGGALLFNLISARIGNRNTVILSLVIWSATLTYIYFAVHGENEFYVAAVLIGLVLGGSQALSRSVYSLMIPKGREAEYFSLYEISDKGTSWIGPLFFGLALQFTGSYRVAIVSLIFFFLVGIAILSKVNVEKGAAAAQGAGSDAG
ncbi:MAG TPA: MFS transporter [Solibacterales bacterium]|nr:MFS transporter [Bryobacterales bacterium]